MALLSGPNSNHRLGTIVYRPSGAWLSILSGHFGCSLFFPVVGLVKGRRNPKQVVGGEVPAENRGNGSYLVCVVGWEVFLGRGGPNINFLGAPGCGFTKPTQKLAIPPLRVGIASDLRSSVPLH